VLGSSRAVRKRPVAPARPWYPSSVLTLTDDARYDALSARDSRFDGMFFVGVSTTGIYCRPICPARTPGRSRCTFYDTAAAAEAAGYRACLRCRPELAPGNADVDAVDQLVAAAAQRIAEGALNDAGVAELAAELGVSARHLRRALEARLGVSPVALAQSRRLALAKQLLQDTALPVTQIAFAAGFASVRRFNAAFAAAFGAPPSRLRRASEAPARPPRLGGPRSEPAPASPPRLRDPRGASAPARPPRLRGPRGAPAPDPAGLVLRLDYRPPYEWAHMLRFLAARAIPGVEAVADGVYRRVVREGAARGTISVRPADNRPALLLEVAPPLVPVLMPLVARVRRMFDLDARPDLIARVLGRDPRLAPLVAARPGLRVPGAVDTFEAAVRALLGQQISVAAATTLAGRFAAALGEPYAAGGAEASYKLTHRFPTAREVAAAGPAAIARLGIPAARAAALHGLASAIAAGTVRLDGVRALEPFVAEVTALPGIGPWTAHYLAMRALHLPDAFPAGDLGVRKALAAGPGAPLPPVRDVEQRAEAWRPFRAYAVLHFWTSSYPDTEALTGGDPLHAPRGRARVRVNPSEPLRRATRSSPC
jgi:AraC family transcriptional regulator, regulatory protein of adaptative response / DNA-3-methyladenine glycosylase II